MRKRQVSAWVIVHCELMHVPKERCLDSLVFHVSSSRQAAEKYIRRGWVSPYSWWENRRFIVDCDDDDADGRAQSSDVHYYSHKGVKLPYAPWDQALKAYKDYRRDLIKRGRKDLL